MITVGTRTGLEPSALWGMEVVHNGMGLLEGEPFMDAWEGGGGTSTLVRNGMEGSLKVEGQRWIQGLKKGRAPQITVG